MGNSGAAACDEPVFGNTRKADLFTIYNPVKDLVYLVDIEEAPTATMNIRWAATENNQTARVIWHADHLLAAKL